MSRLLRLPVRACVLALSSLVLLSARPARADDVLFSTLPFFGNYYSISGPASSLNYTEFAGQFAPSETAFLDNIQIALVHIDGDNNAVTARLFSSVNDQPGVELASSDLPADTLTNTAALYTFDFGGLPLLTQGTPYFVDVSTTGNTFDGWNANSNS